MFEEIVVAGFGGQGVLSLGRLLAYAEMVANRYVSWLPSYGPEMRGGTANCNVVISDEPVGCPLVSSCSTLIAMNHPSLDKFEKTIKPKGRAFINSSLVERRLDREDISGHYLPVNDVAVDLGDLRVTNMVMLGAFMTISGFPSKDNILKAIQEMFGGGKRHLIPLNEDALNRGMELPGL